ncbi:MAG: hypothetical protein IKQ99_00585 [Alphaproteobacteria bacterium]|nr:hypothetical protein [Alphaproteobacteria bacterium]
MKKIFIIFLGTFLVACEQFTPFVDSHREAGEVKMRGQSTPDKPAVCYNPLWSDKKLVEQLAEEECQKTNRHAVYSETDWFSCRFVNPSTAFYKCEKR